MFNKACIYVLYILQCTFIYFFFTPRGHCSLLKHNFSFSMTLIIRHDFQNFNILYLYITNYKYIMHVYVSIYVRLRSSIVKRSQLLKVNVQKVKWRDKFFLWKRKRKKKNVHFCLIRQTHNFILYLIYCKNVNLSIG